MKQLLLCTILCAGNFSYGMESRVALVPCANEITTAALTNNNATLKALLDDQTCDINCQEPNFCELKSIQHSVMYDHRIKPDGKIRQAQYTPLFYIIKDGNGKAFRQFLKRKDINLNLTDSHGCNVLHIAVANKRLSFLKDLLKRVDSALINQPDKYGVSPRTSAERLFWHADIENWPDKEKIEKMAQLLNKYPSA